MSTIPNGETAAAPAGVFVGRERELAELRAGWRDVVAGRGRLFLLHGEAGIGKTRLAETLAADAARDGALIAWGRCWEDGGAPALWPWIQIVRTLARGVDRERATRWFGRGAGYLMQLMPEPGELLPSSVALEPPRTRTLGTPFPMLEALAEFFANASAAAPLVLILDDLHAADGPSLLVLDFLARELPQRRMLLLGTYREVEAQRDGERIALLDRIARQGHHLPLAGLSEADSRRLIELGFVRSPAASVVRALHQSTEGNPFFLDEVVRLLIASPECSRLDHIPAAGLPLPRAVRDAVRQRLQPLSPGCRSVLQMASVIGRQFPFACLREVAGGPEAALLDLLDEAVASVLIAPSPPQHGEYRFVHALIRETLYDDLAAAERMQLHRRAGAAMLALYGAAGDSRIAEIAHHFLEGEPAGEAPAAVELAVRAARRAESIAAFADAAQWYDRAWARVAAQEPDSGQCIELLLARGEAESKAWSTDSARQTFREAARLARSAVDRRLPDAALLFARATLGMGGTGIGMPRGSADAEMIGLLETAVALIAGSAETALEARLRSRLALELYFSDTPERRHALMEAARELARESGDASARAHVANARLVTEWDDPDPRLRLENADAALAAALAVEDCDLEFRARVFRVMDLVELGDPAGWQQEIGRFARGVAAHRRPVYESTLVTLRILDALWLGQFAEAEAMCLGQLANADRWEDPQARVSAGLQLLALRLARGGAAELEPLVRAAATQADASPEARAAFAMVLRAGGNAAEARAVFADLAAHDFADLAREHHLQSILAWLVELACVYGTPGQLLALRSHVAPQSGTFLGFVMRLCFGPAEYYLGLLDEALGDTAAALRSFENAIERSTRTRGRPALAMAQLAAARCLAAIAAGSGPSSEALARLDAAQHAAVDLGMEPALRAIEELRPRLQQRPDGGVAFEQRDVAAGGRRAGRVVPFPRAAPMPKAPARPAPDETPVAVPPAARPPSIFRREEALWTIAHDGIVLRLKPSKGLRYLAELLRVPGRAVHVMDLAAIDQPPSETAGGAGHEFDRSGMHVSRGDGGTEALDGRARAAYRQRLKELREDLDEATAFNDRGRIERIQDEIEALAGELARSVGLGGRDRAQASIVERTRLNVTRALQTAIKRIREGNPALGLHLATSVHTGTSCRYEPGAGPAIPWQF